MQVEEVPLGAVLDRVGCEERGVHLGDRVGQGGEPLGPGAHVRQEQALVLAREGGADPVLQQAGAPHDERPPRQVVERPRQPGEDLGREARVLEHLDDVRVLAANLVDLEVLAVVDVLELVVLGEALQAVRGDEPGLGDLDLADQVAVVLDLAEDLRRQQHPRALAPQLPVTARGADDVVHQVVEVVDPDVGLGGVEEVEVVGEEPAGERDPQAGLHGARQLAVLERELVVTLERDADVVERGARVLEGLDQEARAVVLDPVLDARDNLALGQVGRGDLEGRVGQGKQLGDALPPQRDVVLAGGRARRRLGGEALQQLLRLGDAAPAEVVEQAAREPEQQVLVGAAQEVHDAPPLRLAAVRRARRPRRGLVGLAAKGPAPRQLPRPLLQLLEDVHPRQSSRPRGRQPFFTSSRKACAAWLRRRPVG